MRISDWSSDVCSSDLLGDLLNRKAQIAGIGDETKSLDFGWRIGPVATVPPGCRRDEADLFIVADHPFGHSTRFCCLSDVHSVCRLSRSAFPPTLTEESDMAAAAMMGDRRMPKKGSSGHGRKGAVRGRRV